MTSMTAALLAFVPVALLLTLLPGADTALVTRNALALGPRGARWTILGICAGCVVHATASALGLSAILATSARAYEVVKLVGAAYLIWIGVQSIRSAGRPASAAAPRADEAHGGHPGLQGLLTNLLNPKVALFYLTFLPQFIPAGAPVLRTSLLLAGIHILLGFAWLSLYARFVDRLRGALTRPMVKAWMERVTGGALVLLGARLAWERR
jgi:threonine/homoserine/homoserine lactone efflux protein